METKFRNRRAVSIQNDALRVTMLVEGGHIAEIADRKSGVNPLWLPPWPSIEPSTYDAAKHPAYGGDSESKLLAGIMGHNLCLDIFGGPSDEEAAAGLTVHGEASVAPYTISSSESELTARADLPIAQLKLERRIKLARGSRKVEITETVENMSGSDRPIAWTEHVTLGPPFLEKGVTQFRAPGTRSKVFEAEFTGAAGYMKTGAEFDWPNVPRPGGGTMDLRVYTTAASSGGYTTHLMDPHRERAFFLAFSPTSKTLFGYIWKRTDFPWLGIWEENRGRTNAPWNGRTLTRGLEFGASPMPETRRKMIERGGIFGVPGFRWIPAKSKVRVDYFAFLETAERIPEEPAGA
ncbi:MAG: DUF4432 family protein [Bryobacterales bacterium]|nr:DUF4432 family protein [Bryobacterales bacterium]